MSLVLSTKKLKPNQRDLLLGSGIKLVDYNAIHISSVLVDVPFTIRNAIFTSQHGVKSIFNKGETAQKTPQIEHCFCVGEKTRSLLIENGQKVTENAANSLELARIIAKNYENDQFYYFCSNQRREELPNLLNKENIDLIETICYKNELNSLKFDQNWDGILFFSPSGITSYISKNSPIDSAKHTSIAFCIGATTAKEAEQYFSNVIVANTATIESVIAKAVKTLSKKL